MTEEKFSAIVAKQMPDAEKRRRADFIVDSSQSFDHARAQVRDILPPSLKCAAAPVIRKRYRSTPARGPVMREIVLDTETTGLDPLDGHRLVEVGCVELVNRIPSGQTFHAYFNPQRSMPAEAFAVHGLSEEFLKDKPFFAEVADDLIAFLGDAPLVIHNAAFDLGFLNAELERAGKPLIARERMVDTLLIARRKHPGGSNRLDDLCVRYSIDNSRRTKHGALLDAELLAEVYVELIGARQAQLVLSQASRIGSGRRRADHRPRTAGAACCGDHRRGTRCAPGVYRHARRERDLARLRQFGLTGCGGGAACAPARRWR